MYIGNEIVPIMSHTLKGKLIVRKDFIKCQ